VLAGLLVSSGDVSAQYSDQHPWIMVLPAGLIVVHLVLWLVMLRRRRAYLRAVLRSRLALALAVALLAVRTVVAFGIAAWAGGLQEYRHLVLAVAMFAVTMAGGWFDQWLILRSLGRRR
jgi:hypothetical protein